MAQAHGKARCEPCNFEVSGLLRDLKCPRCAQEMRTVGTIELKDDGVPANIDGTPVSEPN